MCSPRFGPADEAAAQPLCNADPDRNTVEAACVSRSTCINMEHGKNSANSKLRRSTTLLNQNVTTGASPTPCPSSSSSYTEKKHHPCARPRAPGDRPRVGTSSAVSSPGFSSRREPFGRSWSRIAGEEWTLPKGKR